MAQTKLIKVSFVYKVKKKNIYMVYYGKPELSYDTYFYYIGWLCHYIGCLCYYIG